MAELENSYWWHVGRKSILSHQFKKLALDNPSILNIGCGTGGMVPLLTQYGRVTNVDVAEEAVEACRSLGYDAQQFDGERLPYEDGRFDMAVATDVLEHIEADEQALRDWQRVLRPGGHLMLTVPAYQWLWSSHDESLHHHRRYTASSLHRLLNLTGYRVKKRSYIIVFSFPLIVGYRAASTILSNRDDSASYVMLPKPINRLFIGFLQAEARALKYINFPFGTSLIVIAQKPA